MPDVLVSELSSATPTSSSTVLGETGGVVKRFAYSFTQSGTGGIARTLQAKQSEFVTPEDFYLAAEADSGGMIQRALNTIGVTSRGVRLNPASDYSVSAALTVSSKSHFQIWGAGKITQTAADTPIFALTSCTDFEIYGLHLYGLGSDFDPSADGGLGDGITLDTCTDFAVHHNTFKNFGYSAVRVLGGCADFGITDNRIYGTHGLGATVSSGDNYQFAVIVQSGNGLAAPSMNFEVSSNRMRNTAIGVRVEPGSLNYACDDNIIYNTKGQHGFYLNGSGFSASGNKLFTIAKIGIKLQSFQNTGLAYNEGINTASVCGNVIKTCETGISLEKTSSLANDASTVTINGNTISGVASAGYGINAQDCSSGLVIDGNNIDGGAHGILATIITAGHGCSGSISNNVISDTQWAAISAYAFGALTIAGNTATRPCLAAAVATDAQTSAFHVISSATTRRAKVSGNTLFTDTSTGVVNGLLASTVDLELGANDFEAKPITTSSATMRKRTMAGDYEGLSNVTGIGPIADGAKVSKTITVTGAVVTDRVVNVSIASDLQGCSLSAYCTTDTLNLVFTNNTGGSITVSDGFVRYSIMRYAV